MDRIQDSAPSQFCRALLFPLFMTSYRGMDARPQLLSGLCEIPVDVVAPLFRMRDRLKPGRRSARSDTRRMPRRPRAHHQGARRCRRRGVLGADSKQVMQVPGWATHGELQALVASGLRPYRALRAGTVSVATYFGTGDRTGSVAVGKEASLVLVDGNPLENVANAGRTSGVVVRGVWVPKEEIDAKLNALAPM